MFGPVRFGGGRYVYGSDIIAYAVAFVRKDEPSERLLNEGPDGSQETIHH
jgi:hypothetical protein